MNVYEITVSILRVHAESEDAAIATIYEALSVDGIEDGFDVSIEDNA